MGSRRLRVWWRVLGFAPALMLVVSLPSQMFLRCRMDGLVRAACCCPAPVDADQSTGAALQQQSCCDREITSHPLQLAEATRISNEDSAPVAIFLPPVIALSAPMMPRLPRQLGGCGPPRQGPSLVVVKQSFLI
jgi:hypothetical protein